MNHHQPTNQTNNRYQANMMRQNPASFRAQSGLNMTDEQIRMQADMMDKVLVQTVSICSKWVLQNHGRCNAISSQKELSGFVLKSSSEFVFFPSYLFVVEDGKRSRDEKTGRCHEQVSGGYERQAKGCVEEVVYWNLHSNGRGNENDGVLLLCLLPIHHVFERILHLVYTSQWNP